MCISRCLRFSGRGISRGRDGSFTVIPQRLEGRHVPEWLVEDDEGKWVGAAGYAWPILAFGPGLEDAGRVPLDRVGHGAHAMHGSASERGGRQAGWQDWGGRDRKMSRGLR